MAHRRNQNPSTVPRGLLARPLDALVFLLPLILFYEAVSIVRGQHRVIAYDLMQRFFELFGHVGIWAPGVAVVAILLATHVASRRSWSISWRRVGWMYLEAAVLSIPLLLLNWQISLSALSGPMAARIDRIAMGVGAGIYEELVFRLILISLVVIVGVDILRRRRGPVAFVGIMLSSLAFAAHHYQPIGADAFELTSFVFRTVAGIYLAGVFWFRGYGPAAGCHAAYNVVLACT
ncbi:MAG: type II CAAX prenyl endopeptidase Rce1 family protein [Phycisphaerae bacterium]